MLLLIITLIEDPTFCSASTQALKYLRAYLSQSSPKWCLVIMEPTKHLHYFNILLRLDLMAIGYYLNIFKYSLESRIYLLFLLGFFYILLGC